MVKARAFTVVVMATMLTGSAMTASAATRALPRPAVNRVIVANHDTQIDATSSTIRGMGHRLIFALWTMRSLGIVDVSTIFGGYELDLGDGTDPVDPLGAKDKAIKWPTVPPSTSNTPVR